MLPDLPQGIIFQQDGAPPHYSREVRALLDEKLPDSWIGRGGPTNWPPRLPDLTLLEFFLWGYVKDRVFRTRVTSITNLKRRITTAIRTIDTDILENVWNNLNERLNTIIRQNGSHIEHL